MTPIYLFQSKGLVELTRYLEADTLFAFDLDGTLAPLVDHYAEAVIPHQIRETLQRLADVAKVSVITGRSRSTALSMLGFAPHLVVGNHGAEWEGQRDWLQVATCLRWRELLHDALCEMPGVEVEYKGESLSVHYRNAENRQEAQRRINSAVNALRPTPRLVEGHCVTNVLPDGSFTKGEALVAAMAKLGTNRAVYFGDDVTDEHVFSLEGVDVFGIRIGEDQGSAARYYLKKQSEILGLLHSMVGIIESLSSKEEVWALDSTSSS